VPDFFLNFAPRTVVRGSVRITTLSHGSDRVGSTVWSVFVKFSVIIKTGALVNGL